MFGMEQMLTAKLHAIILFSVGLGMSTRFANDRPLIRDVARSLILIGGLVIACVGTQVVSAVIYPPTEISFDYRLMLILGGESLVLFFCLCVAYSLGSIFGVDVSSDAKP